MMLCRNMLRGAVPIVLLLAAPAGASEPGRNHIVNGGFETDASWHPYGGGFVIDDTVAHSGRRSLRCTGTVWDASHGAKQVVTFDPPIQQRLRISGWSRAEGATVVQDYSVYVDVRFADGKNLWCQVAWFASGTHDWEYAEQVIVDIDKPVKALDVHVLFRKAKGTVWFDDIRVEPEPFEWRDVRAVPNLFGGDSLGVFAATSLPAGWEAVLEGPDGAILQGRGERTPIRMVWAAASPPSCRTKPLECRLRLTATDGPGGRTIRRDVPIVLDPTAPRRKYVAWTESSMTRVLPQALPETVTGPRIARIALAGREFESFQVVLLPAPNAELNGVTVEASDLVCAAAGDRIAKNAIDWHQVGYVRADRIRPHPADPSAVPGWWPDPLLPVKTFNVKPGFAQPIWVTVHAPPGTPAGQYVGTVTLRPENALPTTINVRADVYGFALPVMGHLKTAFSLIDGYLERAYGPSQFPKVRRQYGDFVQKHRLNPDDIYRASPPAIEDLLHYRGHGLNTFNVMNLVQQRDETWVGNMPKEAYTPAFRDELIKRLEPTVAQLRRHSLADQAYVYAFDERDEDFFPVIRDVFGAIKRSYPELRTMTTARVPPDPDVMKDLNVDWVVPLTPLYDSVQADRCRAAGLEVWSYVCCIPLYPHANWMASFPLIEARVIWWQAFHQKMDGFLYWGLNIWDQEHNGRPIDPSDGPLLDWSIRSPSFIGPLYGDGRLLYAGKDGPIGSIRLANIRDGLEDYEYLWLLRQQTGDAEAARKACLPVTDSLTRFTREPDVLYKQRETIARAIERHSSRKLAR